MHTSKNAGDLLTARRSAPLLNFVEQHEKVEKKQQTKQNKKTVYATA